LTPVQPDEPMADVFTRMLADGLWQLPVVENGEFVGAITRVGLVLFARTQADAARGIAQAAGHSGH
jgi:predicted transcriptional regulator